MDYILFVRAPAGGVSLQPNPEEVDEVRYDHDVAGFLGLTDTSEASIPMTTCLAELPSCLSFRFVTQAELVTMMNPESGLRWSPWFRIIAEKFLPTWWAKLPEAISTEQFADRARIHHILV